MGQRPNFTGRMDWRNKRTEAQTKKESIGQGYSLINGKQRERTMSDWDKARLRVKGITTKRKPDSLPWVANSFQPPVRASGWHVSDFVWMTSR